MGQYLDEEWGEGEREKGREKGGGEGGDWDVTVRNKEGKEKRKKGVAGEEKQGYSTIPLVFTLVSQHVVYSGKSLGGYGSGLYPFSPDLVKLFRTLVTHIGEFIEG